MKNNSQQLSLWLKEKMNALDISSYQQLSQKAGVSELQIYRLQNGLANKMSVDVLQNIAKGLNLSLNQLIHEIIEDNQAEISMESQPTNDELSDQQQEAIFILESLILQLPTIVKAVETNPNLPAKKLLPLLKPLDKLLQHWGVTQIGNVGDIVTFNPQEHELMDTIDINSQDENLVKIRYVGYRYQAKLLYRAKVCSILD